MHRHTHTSTFFHRCMNTVLNISKYEIVCAVMHFSRSLARSISRFMTMFKTYNEFPINQWSKMRNVIPKWMTARTDEWISEWMRWNGCYIMSYRVIGGHFRFDFLLIFSVAFCLLTPILQYSSRVQLQLCCWFHSSCCRVSRVKNRIDKWSGWLRKKRKMEDFLCVCVVILKSNEMKMQNETEEEKICKRCFFLL